jgi:hypothetical protein
LKRKVVIFILTSIFVLLLYNNFQLNNKLKGYERNTSNAINNLTRSYNLDTAFYYFELILNDKNPEFAGPLSESLNVQINLIQALIKLEEDYYAEEYVDLFYESVYLDETVLYFSNLSTRTELAEQDLLTIKEIYNLLRQLDKQISSSIAYTIHFSTITNRQALLYAYYQYVFEVNALLIGDK